MRKISKPTLRRLTSSMAERRALDAASGVLRRNWRTRYFSTGAPKRISLALQGGGAHGAFTWGVLDVLVRHPEIEIGAVSGSSAGAVNAVLLAQGLLSGGGQGARKTLTDFWTDVGTNIPWPMVATGVGETYGMTQGTKILANWIGQFSPSNLNPMGIDPLRDALLRHVDFEALRRSCPIELFVAATHVRTGKLRLFREHELTVDMVLASACLPKLHKTVEVYGEPYWDGGYSANPAIFPLTDVASENDVLLVLLAPYLLPEAPVDIHEIESRIHELAFRSHFLREMQIQAQSPSVRLHTIEADLDVLQRGETRLLAYAPFLEQLRNHGRVKAKAWLTHHLASVGKNGTSDLSRWLS